MAACILQAEAYGIAKPDWIKSPTKCADAVRKVIIPEFEPKKDAKIVTDETTSISTTSIDDSVLISDLVKKLNLCHQKLPAGFKMNPIQFEKAERSDVLVKPNPYKLLYAFEMRRHNWRKAASYMYLHSAQLKSETALKNYQVRSLVQQERLNCLSATISALRLVQPSSAWIDPVHQGKSILKELYPCKKARITISEEEANDDFPTQKLESCMDIERLENEFVLTSAEHLLFLANVNWTFTVTKEVTFLKLEFS